MLHRQVRLAHQHGDFPCLLGKQADPQRGAEDQLVAEHAHRLAQLDQQAFGQARQAAVPVPPSRRMANSSPARRAEGVGFRRGAPQALGHLPEQLVGDLVAEAVVEQLEAVQVDQQQGQPALLLARPLGRLVQPLAEQPAVGQAGQFVVVQQVTQALLDVAAGTEIGEETDDVGRLAIAVAQQVELQPLG